MPVVVETIESAVLRGNPLGDPHLRHVPVWVPPSYATSPARRYPVILWLAGFSGDGRMLFNWNPWQDGLAERLDRLVAAGMPECIVAAPDCFTRYGGSQYLDSPATGAYETHVVSEVLPALEARLRILPGRDHRAVGGKSSGGFGAITLGMRHPEVFAAVACHSGDAYFELSVIPEIPRAVRTFRRWGGVSGFLRHFAGTASKKSDDIGAIMKLAEASAYSPDPTSPLGFALPFDLETGELDDATWRRWKAWDPVEAAARHAAALRDCRLLFIDAGTRDEWHLDLAARVLVARLRALGARPVHEEFEDGHMSIPYRYDVSLPLLARAISPPP